MYKQWHLPYRHHKATEPAWGLLGWHSAGWALALFLKSDDVLRETTVRKDLKSYQQGVTQPKWSRTPLCDTKALCRLQGQHEAAAQDCGIKTSMNTLALYRKLAGPRSALLWTTAVLEPFTDLLQGHMGVEASWHVGGDLGTGTPLKGLQSKGGSQMMLSAFRDTGIHLAMGHSEVKLLIYITPLFCFSLPPMV